MTADPLDSRAEPAGPRGLRGWLLLPAVSTFIAPLFVLKGAVELVGVITDPVFAAFPIHLKAIMVGETAVNIALVCVWIVAAVLLIKRKALYPKVLNGLLLFTFVLLVSDLILAAAFLGASMASEAGPAVRALIACAIWVPYMLRSQRVRNTFVN